MQQMIGQNHGIGLPGDEWAEACAGVFFAKATKATGDLFRRVESYLSANDNVEDQQALNIVLRNSSFAHIALDTNPLDLITDIGANDLREPSFTYSYLPQLEVWSAHTRFRAIVL
jgi:Nucleotide-diphospho-sugar transferase